MSTKKSIARDIVADWYQQWTGYPKRPKPYEIMSAATWIDRVGAERLVRVLPILIDIMRTEWPQAKHWSGAEAYLPESLAELDERDQAAAAQKKKVEATAKLLAPSPPLTPEQQADFDAAHRRLGEAIQERKAAWSMPSGSVS